MKPKTITVELYGRLAGATDIEGILCLGTVVASGYFDYRANVQDAAEYNERFGCADCPFEPKCLASIINE